MDKELLVVAIKDMASGNESVGEMWKETKIFNANESIFEVMKWVGTTKKQVVLTIPDNSFDLYNKLILFD